MAAAFMHEPLLPFQDVSAPLDSGDSEPDVATFWNDSWVAASQRQTPALTQTGSLTQQGAPTAPASRSSGGTAVDTMIVRCIDSTSPAQVPLLPPVLPQNPVV